MTKHIEQDIDYLERFPEVDFYTLSPEDLEEARTELLKQKLMAGTINLGQPLAQETARLRSFKLFSLKRDDWIEENKQAKEAQLQVYKALKEEFDKR